MLELSKRLLELGFGSESSVEWMDVYACKLKFGMTLLNVIKILSCLIKINAIFAAVMPLDYRHRHHH
jgi:hypothetical protein